MCPEYAFYLGIHLTTEEKSKDKAQHGSRNIQVSNDSLLLHDKVLIRFPKSVDSGILQNFGRAGSPSFSVGVCRAAEIGDSPHHPIFEWNVSVRSTQNVTNPREFACYQCANLNS